LTDQAAETHRCDVKCVDPDRPGEDFALTPPHYQCGDPDIITSDGGW